MADNWDDLTDGTIDAPINASSEGFRFDDVGVAIWSSTLASGEISPTDNCNDWSSSAGSGTNGNNLTTDATPGLLIPGTVRTCDTGDSRVFCLQQ